MFGMFGTAAKKTAQALDLIEEDQPTAEEIAEAQELFNEVEPVHSAVMAVPQKVGLVEPIIIDPQVIFERLTELFGVYKGAKTVHDMYCHECGHEWEEENSPDIDWDEDFTNCTDCGCEETFDYFHNGKSVNHITSRTPTQPEIAFAVSQEIYYPWQYNSALVELKQLFAALNGDTPVDYEGDDLTADIPRLLTDYRDIKSLSEMNQINGLGSDGVVYDEGFDGI